MKRRKALPSHIARLGRHSRDVKTRSPGTVFKKDTYEIRKKLYIWQMSVNEVILLITIGSAAGFVAGALGVGGGIIMIPAMVFILGLTQHQAQGTSLAIMIPPIGIVAAYNYYKAGQVNINYALVMILAFVAASYFGSKLAINLPAIALKRIFAVLLFVVAIKMFIGK